MALFINFQYEVNPFEGTLSTKRGVGGVTNINKSFIRYFMITSEHTHTR